MPLTPEMLVEKMLPKSCCKKCAEHNLRIVLQAIEDGEVMDRTYNDMSGRFIYHGMKQNFAKFLKEK